MVLKNSERHSGKIIVFSVYFSPWRIKGESLNLVLVSPKKLSFKTIDLKKYIKL